MAAYREKRRILSTGDFRGGNASSYARINDSGMLTLASCARVLTEKYVGAKEMYSAPLAGSGAGLSGSLYMKVGAGEMHVPTWSPCSTTCDMKLDFSFNSPNDAATSGSVTPWIEMLINTATATPSSMGFTLWYNYVTSGSIGTSGSVQGSIAATSASLAKWRVSGSLPQLPSFTNGTQCYFLLQMHTGACTAGSLYDVAAVRLSYVRDRLGTQTTTG